jgi:hypothetical protein
MVSEKLTGEETKTCKDLENGSKFLVSAESSWVVQAANFFDQLTGNNPRFCLLGPSIFSGASLEMERYVTSYP